MKEAPPQSTENRRRHFGKRRWWLLALFLAAFAYPAWREYDYRCAVSEARAAGLFWGNTSPWDLIREDWHNALKRKTWSTYWRGLAVTNTDRLKPHRDLIRRLRPTDLEVRECEDENLDGLKEVTSLKELAIIDCPNLQNLDAISGLRGLQNLDLYRCFNLQNVDALKGLTGLQKLSLGASYNLQNVDALKNLTGLRELYLGGCEKISDNSLRELRTALPNTDITFPSGTKDPPQ